MSNYNVGKEFIELESMGYNLRTLEYLLLFKYSPVVFFYSYLTLAVSPF